MNALNRILLVALASPAFLVGAHAAQSQKGAGGGGWASFQKVDTDGSGMISKEEASKVQGLDFSEVDRNHDGQLSKSEYEAAKGAKKNQKTERQQQRSGSGGSRY